MQIPGILQLDEPADAMTRIRIAGKAARAELYLQGAHLTHWQPIEHRPVLFLSEDTAIQPGKAIRGGVPLIFPWFGARTTNSFSQRSDGPSHGFARTAQWQLNSAEQVGDDISLTFSLGADESTRALGFDQFQVSYHLCIGRELTMALTVENLGGEPQQIEEAFHTYFLVDDVQNLFIHGLQGYDYLDKTDAMKRKTQAESSLRLCAETDRPYLNTEATIEIEDPGMARTITIRKTNSRTTVVWNPWADLSSKLADMSKDGWKKMICIESANAFENAVIIAPGEKHSMGTSITVKKN